MADIKAALGAAGLVKAMTSLIRRKIVLNATPVAARVVLESPALHAAVQALIAAERERCAQIADDLAPASPQRDTATKIAAAIRSPEGDR